MLYIRKYLRKLLIIIYIPITIKYKSNVQNSNKCP